ncbi:YgaP-like transmembrane domain [Massilia sp. W12]|uniref:YgaP-like transmembrane domain n=1 Tax=Massilia sp. W12 TaxID=3126507 RepID=UPI0030CA6790
MKSWQIVRIVAACMILLSLLLGVPGSPLFHAQAWLALSAFVALNLLQSGFSRWCLMESLLRRLGVRGGC